MRLWDRVVSASVAASPQEDQRPLHWASEHDHAPVVSLLLEAGADVNAADEVRELSVATIVWSEWVGVERGMVDAVVGPGCACVGRCRIAEWRVRAAQSERGRPRVGGVAAAGCWRGCRGCG